MAVPVLNKVIYNKSGIKNIFNISFGIFIINFIIRILLIKKKTAVKYNVTKNNREVNKNVKNKKKENKDRKAREEDPLIKKQEEDYYKVLKG